MKLNKTIAFVIFISLAGCKHDPDKLVVATNYPANVEKIITTNCAVTGCHNTASKDAAAGLDLTTWETMFNGTTVGASVIPFRTDFSTFLYFINVDSTIGLAQKPTMPINKNALSTADYLTIKNWIGQGARNANDDVMFPDNPSRHKYYVANQGCDVVSVFDADKNIVIKMVDVGVLPGVIESPHALRVTPDGKYWIVVFLSAQVVQVYSTVSDQLVQSIPIGDGIAGGWNSLTISSDSKKAYAIDYTNGRVAFVDLVNGTSSTKGPFPITGGTPKLHGVALSQNNDTIYVTCQDLSELLKIPVNDIFNYEEVDLYKTQPLSYNLNPHEVMFSPDYSKYFVTCQNTNVNQVRVYDTHTDHLITSIPVGKVPLEFSMAASKNLLFVSNEEDDAVAGYKGSVSVIDINTLTETKRITVGWQPHGLAVDERLNLVYVAARNVSGGLAPHHSSVCVGRNGYMTLIDMNTLTVKSIYKTELTVDPYAVGVVK